MSLKLLLLLLTFQVKHFLCDYPLQTPYMLQKFKRNGWVEPLAAHAAVHACGTFMVCAVFGFSTTPIGLMVILALFDFVAHFTMDRIKASPDMLGKYKILSAAEYPTATPFQKVCNTYAWWALGYDQFVHHCTHYAIIWLLVH